MTAPSPEEQLRVYSRLYADCREVLDNIAIELVNWHGMISRDQFIECFEGVEDLIPDSLRDANGNVVKESGVPTAHFGGAVQNPGGMIGGVNHDVAPGAPDDRPAGDGFGGAVDRGY